MRLKGKNGKKSINDRRGTFPIDHTLEELPQEAQRRERIGDIEADTVLGKAGGECLVTLVDRRSRLSPVRKSCFKNSSSCQQCDAVPLGRCALSKPDARQRGRVFALPGSKRSVKRRTILLSSTSESLGERNKREHQRIVTGIFP